MKSATGHRVVAIDTAEEIGEIRHFVVSADVTRIERLHVDGRKKKAVFAEWSDLESFGDDRVMVVSSGAPTESSDERDIEAARGHIELIGSRILDTAGFERGTVRDATFESETGEIVALVSSDEEEIPAGSVRSLGSYAVVVDG
ncbi:hypothetical protein [Ilumatobacter sp.]|uniref:hypothetical protein n=1 Tax=Ilumatobacter sp. TaxID=1967498 RepID=UPI003B520ACF